MKIYSFENENLKVKTSTFGANILSIEVKDSNGNFRDVVLGYDKFEQYKNQTKYIGATVGRCCNRIKEGKITVDNVNYQLNCNDDKNHLHGGNIGFDKKEWTETEIKNGVKYSYHSPDGEENYPGNLNVEVKYTLENNSLIINYIANSDKDTICNLTNHTYFNLNGNGDILNHYIQIFADEFTENDTESLPTGKILNVENTPMDFRIPKQIKNDIENSYYQIQYAKGFDNNWIINKNNNEITIAAKAFSKDSGITLEVYTDLPGVQFYSGNFLDGAENCKKNQPIKNHSGFCLECQYFPNALANKNFPQPILKAGEVYNKTIIYKFS